MWKRKLCLSTSPSFGIPVEEQIKLFGETGFEAFFTSTADNVKECRKIGDTLGMIYQSLHAPFGRAAQMWLPASDAKEAVNEMMESVETCASVEVPLLIAHVWIGFGENSGPNEQGVENWDRIIRRADELGVNIAFENTEGEEFLDKLLSSFKDRRNVGFCFDSGHEMCYNKSRDLLALYGDRLIATHINDNLGIRDYNGRITFRDDLHLLPFDGVKDWTDFARRIQRCGYGGELTFELKLASQIDRHENDAYGEMPFERYLAEAYKRACRVATLVMAFGGQK